MSAIFFPRLPPLRLPRESLVNIIIGFPVQEASNVILIRESLKTMKLVLEHPPVKIAAHADVESACKTAQDVNTVVPSVARHHWSV